MTTRSPNVHSKRPRRTQANRTHLCRLVGVLGLCAGALATSSGQTFRKLDNFHWFAQEWGTVATQISDDGRFVSGGTWLVNGAVRWDMSAVTTLWGGSYPSNTGAAMAISSDGSVLVGRSTGQSGYPESVRWQNGTLTTLPTFSGAIWNYASDVSVNGDITVGHVVSLAGQQIFRYTTSTNTLEDMGDSGGQNNGKSIRCNGDGSLIVDFESYWTPTNGWQQLPGLLALGLEASDDGRYIVGTSKFNGGGYRGLRFDVQSGAQLDLGTLGGYSDMQACSADGSVVVGTSHDLTTARAVWWRASQGLRDLNVDFASIIPTGWMLHSAHDITPDGRYITGYGFNESGVGQSFVIDTVPEPGTTLAIVAGLVGLARRRKGK